MARASTVTHEAKMDIVSRIAAGADAVGVDELLIVREPFRIAERALQWMPLRAKVVVCEIDITHTELDTQSAIREFLDRGVTHVVALGGDGTHRIIAKTAPDLYLVPLSTGTNNAFPLNVEPTIAGMIGGLAAQGSLDDPVLSTRSKVAHLTIDSQLQDIGLIDIARVTDDFVGNYRPFDTENLRELVLTRAHPDAIGMSAIGGLLSPIHESDDAGLWIRMGKGRKQLAPISPGLLKQVDIANYKQLSLDEAIQLEPHGLVAIDGDRLYDLSEAEDVSVELRRDGPFVFNVDACMRYAVGAGLVNDLDERKR